MQFSLTFCHFISLWSKYSPHHPVPKHPQSMFLPQCQSPRFTHIQNKRQNYSFVYSNFYVFTQQTRDKRFWTEINLQLISSIKFWFVTVIPKYLIWAHFQRIYWLSLHYDFSLHSGDDSNIYEYLVCLRSLLDQPPY
jgi:hypothetical protein